MEKPFVDYSFVNYRYCRLNVCTTSGKIAARCRFKTLDEVPVLKFKYVYVVIAAVNGASCNRIRCRLLVFLIFLIKKARLLKDFRLISIYIRKYSLTGAHGFVHYIDKKCFNVRERGVCHFTQIAQIYSICKWRSISNLILIHKNTTVMLVRKNFISVCYIVMNLFDCYQKMDIF